MELEDPVLTVPSFPFYIFFPSWVAIFVPIISRQRQEAKNNEEERKIRLEEEKLMNFIKKKKDCF